MAVTSISRDTQQFSSFDVTARITAILADAGYAVTRARTGRIVFAARTEEACSTWLRDEDYDPERFAIARGPLMNDDAAELDRLRRVEARAQAATGSASWAMFRKDWFTADWARDEAGDLAGLTPEKQLQWPLNCIDWKLAALTQRDACCTAVTFDGREYYAREI